MVKSVVIRLIFFGHLEVTVSTVIYAEKLLIQEFQNGKIKAYF